LHTKLRVADFAPLETRQMARGPKQASKDIASRAARQAPFCAIRNHQQTIFAWRRRPRFFRWVLILWRRSQASAFQIPRECPRNAYCCTFWARGCQSWDGEKGARANLLTHLQQSSLHASKHQAVLGVSRGLRTPRAGFTAGLMQDVVSEARAVASVPTAVWAKTFLADAKYDVGS